jgi:hypothetical protein
MGRDSTDLYDVFVMGVTRLCGDGTQAWSVRALRKAGAPPVLLGDGQAYGVSKDGR